MPGPWRLNLTRIFPCPAGCPPIYHFGSQELQDRVLPEIMSGKKRVCLAITEPEAGSDVKNLSTEAKLSADGKHYIVNGVRSSTSLWTRSCSDSSCTNANSFTARLGTLAS